MRRLTAGLIVSIIFTASAALAAQNAEEDAFAACLPGLQEQALARGIAPATAQSVFPALEYQARVIELDRAQPEFMQSFADYFSTRVSADRIDKGRRLYRQHSEFLNTLVAKYGVPGQYLVAFWGLETNFGTYLGSMPTLDSLATLACDPRRSEFFSEEFLLALELMEREQLPADKLKGSWAGAVGHTQFMPSNYLRYAVDGDGDGQIDLWGSQRDALTSAANFLNQLGWRSSERWGREVQLPEDFDFSLAPEPRLLTQWRALGVREAHGAALPVGPGMSAQLLVPAGHTGPAFLVYDNFEVIMRWNRSTSYALSVGHLADRISGAGPLVRATPTDQPRLRRSEVMQLQDKLNAAGFDCGEPDGLLGPATRAALRDYQLQHELVADGFPDAKTLTLIGVGTY